MLGKWLAARRERRYNLKNWRELYLKTLNAPEKASDFMIEMAVESMPRKVKQSRKGKILWQHYLERVVRKKLQGNHKTEPADQIRNDGHFL